MSNTNNKNEQTKNIQEINGFISDKVKPFIADIISTRALIDKTLSNISSIKNAKIEKEVVQENPSIDEVIVDQPVKAEKVAKVKAEKTAEAKSESKPAVEEKPQEVKVESTVKPEVENPKVQPTENKPTQQSAAKVYINPDMKDNRNRNGYNNNRPAQTTQGGYNNGTRPQGQSGYNNNRPQGQGGYNNGTRPQGQSGYNNNRPQGQGGYNNNARPQGQGGFNNRPPQRAGGFNKPSTIPAAPIIQKKDTAKKKVNPGYSKDDNKKAFNKRDLIKRGYDIDSSLMNDGAPTRYLKNKKVKKETQFTPQFIKIEHVVITTENISIKSFSEKIGKSSTEIVKKLFDMGKFVTINDSISFEDAEFVAIEYGITCELKLDKTAEDALADFVAVNTDTEDMVKRPPIVTIMGHVDHGKTSLLDYIRNANVVNTEAGGITQHIGAYSIEVNNEKITFLDTPGHEAFTAMRRRGAKVTDISIIVVAADDGIMPQTIEAINHSKEAGVAIIVAINKIDKTDGNIDRIKQQLANHNVLADDWGGDTIMCPVSAKTGQGVKELLENVLLVAEVLELKANKKCKATGSIIEARLDKGAGPIATVLVQNGTLKVKDYVVAGTAIGKIRAMTDHLGRRLKEATPSTAVQVQGFAEVPNAGEIMVVVDDEKLAKQVAQERVNKERSGMSMSNNARSLDEMFKNAAKTEVKTLPLLIKADVQGSAEAVKQSLLKLSDEMAEENVKIHIIHTGVGAISESDIMLADTSGAIIIAFNVRPDPKAKLLADKSNVEIRAYSIIYNAIEDIQLALNGMTTPKYKENITGHAEIRAVFKLSSQGVIAGSYVLDGKIARNSNARILRGDEVVYDGKIASIRREKDDVKDIAAGYECGIGLDKFDDIKVGDIIEAFVMERIKNNE